MGHSINPVSYSSLRYCIGNKNVPLFPLPVIIIIENHMHHQGCQIMQNIFKNGKNILFVFTLTETGEDFVRNLNILVTRFLCFYKLQKETPDFCLKIYEKP